MCHARYEEPLKNHPQEEDKICGNVFDVFPYRAVARDPGEKA